MKRTLRAPFYSYFSTKRGSSIRHHKHPRPNHTRQAHPPTNLHSDYGAYSATPRLSPRCQQGFPPAPSTPTNAHPQPRPDPHPHTSPHPAAPSAFASHVCAATVAAGDASRVSASEEVEATVFEMTEPSDKRFDSRLRRSVSMRLATRACQSLIIFCLSGGSIASNSELSRLALCPSCRFAHSEKRVLTTARQPPMAKPRLPTFEGYLSTFEGYSKGMKTVSMG